MTHWRTLQRSYSMHQNYCIWYYSQLHTLDYLKIKNITNMEMKTLIVLFPGNMHCTLHLMQYYPNDNQVQDIISKFKSHRKTYLFLQLLTTYINSWSIFEHCFHSDIDSRCIRASYKLSQYCHYVQMNSLQVCSSQNKTQNHNGTSQYESNP